MPRERNSRKTHKNQWFDVFILFLRVASNREVQAGSAARNIRAAHWDRGLQPWAAA